MIVTCPLCGASNFAPDHLSGQSAKCQACQGLFAVPYATDDSPPPGFDAEGCGLPRLPGDSLIGVEDGHAFYMGQDAWGRVEFYVTPRWEGGVETPPPASMVAEAEESTRALRAEYAEREDEPDVPAFDFAPPREEPMPLLPDDPDDPDDLKPSAGPGASATVPPPRVPDPDTSVAGHDPAVADLIAQNGGDWWDQLGEDRREQVIRDRVMHAPKRQSAATGELEAAAQARAARKAEERSTWSVSTPRSAAQRQYASEERAGRPGDAYGSFATFVSSMSAVDPIFGRLGGMLRGARGMADAWSTFRAELAPPPAPPLMIGPGEYADDVPDAPPPAPPAPPPPAPPPPAPPPAPMRPPADATVYQWGVESADDDYALTTSPAPPPAPAADVFLSALAHHLDDDEYGQPAAFGPAGVNPIFRSPAVPLPSMADRLAASSLGPSPAPPPPSSAGGAGEARTAGALEKIAEAINSAVQAMKTDGDGEAGEDLPPVPQGPPAPEGPPEAATAGKGRDGAGPPPQPQKKEGAGEAMSKLSSMAGGFAKLFGGAGS